MIKIINNVLTTQDCFSLYNGLIKANMWTLHMASADYVGGRFPGISLIGDGGFGMTISEISTAVEHKINTVTIVMNNKSWGAEKAYQKDFFGKRYIGSDIISPPFDQVAELYGAKGYKVKKLSEVNSVVRAALNCNKPAVIDVDVDPKALYSFRRDSFKHRSK